MSQERDDEKEAFFEELGKAEILLNIKIPMDLKNILFINGYTSISVVSEITEEDIKNIEMFARETLPSLIPNSEYKSYYGVFHNATDKFCILNGHKKILKLLKNGASVFKADSSKQKSPLRVKTMKSPERKKYKSTEANTPARTEVRTKSIDLATENSIIHRNLKKWVKSKCTDEIWEKVQTSVDMLIIQCSYEDEAYSCNIRCFCNNTVKILKARNSPTAPEKWIYGNFYKHYMKHLGNADLFHKGSGSGSGDTTEDTTEVKRELNRNWTCRKKKIGVAAVRPITDFFHKTLDKTSREQTTIQVHQDIILKKKKRSSSLTAIDTTAPAEEKEYMSEQTEELTEKESESGITFEKEITDPVTEGVMDFGMIPSSKWSAMKYQRSERLRRKRERQDDSQTLISNYFPVVEKIDEFIAENSCVSKHLVENLIEYSQTSHTTIEDFHLESEQMKSLNDKPITKNLLNKLIEISSKNINKPAQKNSFDSIIKKFATYIYYIGGRLLYETLSSNLSNILPSISTINRFVNHENKKLEEGSFDFEGLSNFLERRNLQRLIWIGEDATRITGKIEYDSSSNKVLGFTLPLSDEGIPENRTYIASSAEKIFKYFTEAEKSHYAYVIMAQPVSSRSPSYCLSIFGTNNRFTSVDVSKRWNYIKKEAAKYNIQIIGFSSDGDSRLLKAMRINCRLPMPIDNSQWPWFHMDINGCTCCFVQDSVHISTKMRTRLLKPSVILPMGNYVASVSHLEILIAEYSKDKHFIIPSDLKPEDKMNYRAAEKMCSDVVIKLLENIPDAQGTIAYLTLMKYSVSAFLDATIDLETRIYRLWYSVFFLRIWKCWISEQSTYSSSKNFLTSNCYSSIELNAHNLIQLVQIYRTDQNLRNAEFTPWLFSSQVCEQIFRATRSLTSTYSTVVNFSIKEILNRISRISTINDIMHDLNNEFIFPRENKIKVNSVSPDFSQFSVESIEKIVERSLRDALHRTQELGMSTQHDDAWKIVKMNYIEDKNIPGDLKNDHDFQSCSIIDEKHAVITHNILNLNIREDGNILKENQEENIDSIMDLSEISAVKNELNLKDFSDSKMSKISENSPFVQVSIGNKTLTVKKSTLCWLLDQKESRVSNDRLKRFILEKKNEQNSMLQPRSCEKQLEIQSELKIGTWCIFSIGTSFEKVFEINSRTIEKKNILRKFLVGRILSFSYLSGKLKHREFPLKEAPVAVNMTKRKIGIGCLCTWYTVELDELGNAVLNKINLKNVFYDISKYVFSISSSAITTEKEAQECKAKISEKLLQEILHELHIKEEKCVLYSSDSSDDEIKTKVDQDDKSRENDINLSIEKYYAVYYDDRWYIGRILSEEKEKYRMKFLQEDLESFIWPTKEDIDGISKSQILYGPIEMIGCGPFFISTFDRSQISKKYKELKKTFYV